MSKRSWEYQPSDLPPAKRIRDVVTGPVDRLSSLSDELLLNILSFLPVSSLNLCQTLSHRFHTLSGDSELWKRQYYSQWVRPRARRLANVRRSTSSAKMDYSPKVSTWLDHSHLAEEGKVTNWKRQYRLRHNWSRGLCRVTEVEFPQHTSPPTLVKLCAGNMLSTGFGLGPLKIQRGVSANTPFADPQKKSGMLPTALVVSHQQNQSDIVVGFDNGLLNRYIFNVQTCQLILRSSYVGLSDGTITAMALSSPYLLTVSQHRNLSLYNLGGQSHELEAPVDIPRLHELASLKADNMVAPMTLSLRSLSFGHCGHCCGIQELRFDKDGQQLDCRIASTVDSQYGMSPLQGTTPPLRRRHSATIESIDNEVSAPGVPSILHQQPPTSMSYSHPYLLTSHADNTLTMYLVVSDLRSLYVRGGQRLWGHTSSVSAVQVTNRGKAVSVSSRGDEIRIWELETAVSSLGRHKPQNDENSIQVSPGNKRQAESVSAPTPKSIQRDLDGSGMAPCVPQEMTRRHECVGFDEERVLLLQEKQVGTQLLECYDFT
ncbi:uncharacterized protein N7477_009254 [Penicillium maclennaniae]|uniref:uncharacterized protein n=1 Tax=Penicillium maclennaniae TaxID=1343394 RepID=UPI002540FCA7|nr:uncharacterized protein N7477_009254 [Penicillium maclennaniae]KAJ5661638.1 hypothetical protein N7477_009254 [Penicillium maclennaniae]